MPSPDSPLGHQAKVRLALLALPTFGLALSITIVSTYVGESARRYTHDAVLIGVIVGAEGAMALWIPLIAGSWSDRLRTRLGGRLPFVLAGGVPAAVALGLIGVMPTLGLVAAMAAVFFAFYFVAYEPYRALYPDLIEDRAAGRAQSTQAVARGLGTACALLAGGLLLSVARALPFAVAGGLLLVCIGAFTWLMLRQGLVANDSTTREETSGLEVAHAARMVRSLLREHPALRAYFFANALWEMALATLKAFVILYLTVGLRYSLTTSSLIIGAVALVILVGAGVSGKMADRYGQIKVMRIALMAYGIGYLIPVFTTDRPLIVVAIPFIAIGGGTVMTMAYALLMPMMPAHAHGALTGFYSMSRGIGIVCGPILAGGLITVTGGFLPGTHGYQAMWIVCALATLTSLYFLARLQRAGKDRRALHKLAEQPAS